RDTKAGKSIYLEVNKMKKDPKTKILFTLPVDLKEELLKEAEKENRSLNNYILTLLIKRTK
ncbi:MAG: hypothetical protein K0M69_08445, partial [Youngiibacter sp.]|nr:hypothetical protein [Youngiibacter sp.]